MKHIIFDCDSTVGIPGYPMDDALALLYLLGRPHEAEILGITCTFGNGTASQVYGSTGMLLREIGWKGIPLLPGADKEEDPRSIAAQFIVETVNAMPHKVTLMAIGSLTNLYGAWLLDPHIFEKVKEIVLMGGYTAPLLYHGQHLDELNFSSNPEASTCVLTHGRNISILTGNNTLEPSYLPKEEFLSILNSGTPSGKYIAEKCGYRFDNRQERKGSAISYCWDVVASVYLLHPELFTDMPTYCHITQRNLHCGWLGATQEAPDAVLLNLPVVKNLEEYRKEMYDGWLDFRREDTP